MTPKLQMSFFCVLYPFNCVVSETDTHEAAKEEEEEAAVVAP